MHTTKGFDRNGLKDIFESWIIDMFIIFIAADKFKYFVLFLIKIVVYSWQFHSIYLLGRWSISLIQDNVDYYEQKWLHWMSTL